MWEIKLEGHWLYQYLVKNWSNMGTNRCQNRAENYPKTVQNYSPNGGNPKTGLAHSHPHNIKNIPNYYSIFIPMSVGCGSKFGKQLMICMYRQAPKSVWKQHPKNVQKRYRNCAKMEKNPKLARWPRGGFRRPCFFEAFWGKMWFLEARRATQKIRVRQKMG